MQAGNPNPSPRAVCVTGMHRCGTSFVAGALRFLGVDLGDAGKMMRPGRDNPAGYFEIQAMMELDDELLAHLGGAWDAPPLLDPGWEHDPHLDELRTRAAQLLEEVFGPTASRPSLVGWKDPRLSLLLPFWRTVMPIDTTIVMVRDPREVAASLAARKYSVAPPQAASLWLRYVYAAVTNDPGYLLIRFDDAFENLEGTLASIAQHLGLPAPETAALADARRELDPGLRHHDASRTAPEVDNPLMALAVTVWNEGVPVLDRLPTVVADAIARGWLASPADGELLARARADVVRCRETLRQTNRRLESRA
jgi:hypothetical protein